MNAFLFQTHTRTLSHNKENYKQTVVFFLFYHSNKTCSMLSHFIASQIQLILQLSLKSDTTGWTSRMLHPSNVKALAPPTRMCGSNEYLTPLRLKIYMDICLEQIDC